MKILYVWIHCEIQLLFHCIPKNLQKRTIVQKGNKREENTFLSIAVCFSSNNKSHCLRTSRMLCIALPASRTLTYSAMVIGSGCRHFILPYQCDSWVKQLAHGGTVTKSLGQDLIQPWVCLTPKFMH